MQPEDRVERLQRLLRADQEERERKQADQLEVARLAKLAREAAEADYDRILGTIKAIAAEFTSLLEPTGHQIHLLSRRSRDPQLELLSCSLVMGEPAIEGRLDRLDVRLQSTGRVDMTIGSRNQSPIKSDSVDCAEFTEEVLRGWVMDFVEVQMRR